MGKTLKPHPLALLWPRRSPEQLAALEASLLSSSGQTQPIYYLKNLIIDGVHRYELCLKHGLKPILKHYDGDTSEAGILQAIIGYNGGRDLEVGQRGILAAELEPRFAAFVADRKKEIGKASAEKRHGRVPANLPEPTGEAREIVAKLFAISPHTVSDCKLIMASDKKLAAQVKAGEMTVNRAKRLISRNVRRKFVAKRLISHRASVEDCLFLCGDFLKASEKLPRGKFRLAFFDPPYNLGFKYDADPTKDSLAPLFYERMIRRAVEIAKELLTPDGTLCLMICEEWVDLFGQIVRKAGFHVRRLIVWHETFGQSGKTNFGRTCRYIWYCTKHPTNFVFDESALLTVAKRESQYADKRAMPGGKVLDALWEISRVCGTYAERVPDEGVPTQLPEELVKRCVAGFTDPGDSVVDFFGGSGTTARAALRLGRKCVIIDRSKKYIDIARRELLAMVAKEASRD